MTYHVQILLLVRQPLFDRAALLLTQTSWVLPPLSVGKMTLRLYGALNYSHGLSKGPSFGTGRAGKAGRSDKENNAERRAFAAMPSARFRPAKHLSHNTILLGHRRRRCVRQLELLHSG